MMDRAGLRVNYSRVHPGQGTTNLCACLDDVFLELLWLDGSAVALETERISLGARGRGDGLPIGISWRGDAPFICEPYAAPFLPPGVVIPVAKCSLDPGVPFIFQSPGGTRPIDRTDGLPGKRQRPELAVLSSCRISVPDPGGAADVLSAFERIKIVRGKPELRMKVMAPDGITHRDVVWSVPV